MKVLGLLKFLGLFLMVMEIYYYLGELLMLVVLVQKIVDLFWVVQMKQL